MAEGKCKAVSLMFRIAALGLSVGAVVVMGTASQQILVAGSPESSSHSVSISYSHYNALRYFVAASAIAAVCSAAALYLFAVCTAVTVFSLPLVPLFDTAAQAFLFSAAGAALAARDVLEGSSVCAAAGAFCSRVTVAAAFCAFAAVSAAVAALARDAGGHGSSEGSRCDW